MGAVLAPVSVPGVAKQQPVRQQPAGADEREENTYESGDVTRLNFADTEEKR